MKGKPFRIGALALFLPFGLLACGGDGPTESTGGLTQAEAEVMMEALSLAGGSGFLGSLGGAAPVSGPALQPGPLVITVDCSGGGTVQISAQISVTGQGESMSITQTLVHNSCTESAPSDGSSWTFNGNPSLVMQLTGSATESSVNFQGTQTGSVRWASGGRSGSCSTNVQYSLSGSPSGSGTMTISGTVCGHDVSGSYSFTG